MRTALLAGFLAALLLLGGCAALGHWFCAPTPAQIDQAAKGLHTLDSFYGKLVDAKILPDYTQQATLGLTAADQAAQTYKELQAGFCKDDESLNQAAVNVQASQAVAQQLGAAAAP